MIRLALLAGSLGILGGAASRFAVQVIWPSDSQSALAHEVAALKDSIHAHGVRLDSIARDSRSTRYISCQVLARVQPANAVPAEPCLP